MKKEADSPDFAAEARRYCAALELGDSNAFTVWSKIRNKSVDHLDAMWKDLGISYDVVQVKLLLLVSECKIVSRTFSW